MNHIEFFIDQVQSIKRTRFAKKVSGGWLRPTAIYVAWKFNGLSVAETSKMFGTDRVSVYYCINRCCGYHEVEDEKFIIRYNEILDIYIKSTTHFLNKKKFLQKAA